MDSKSSRNIIYTVFFISGACALIYEVVWFRMLSRIFGNTVYATSTVLAVFMCGLALGSFVFGKIGDRVRKPLLLYSLLEGGIALCALLMPFAFQVATLAYVSLYQNFHFQFELLTFTRVLICFVCLLVPTTLMGATFPVMNRHIVKTLGQLGQKLSLLYALNTAGAVLGAGLAGFWLIANYGESFTTHLGVFFNAIIAIIALLISAKSSQISASIQQVPAATNEPAPFSKDMVVLAFVAVFFTGITSLAYEVLWTRILTLFLGTSIYAFTTILVIFLSGIAVGSWLLSRFIDTTKDLMATLGVVIFMIGVFTLAAQHFFYVTGLKPQFTILSWRGIGSQSDIGLFFLSSALPIFLVTLFFGIAFPLAAKIAVGNMGSLGKSIGGFYATNTIGSVIGPLLAGFCLIPFLGTHRSILLLALFNALLGFWIVSYAGKLGKIKWALPVAAGTALMALFLSSAKDPFYSSISKNIADHGYDVIYHKEGSDSTVTIAAKNKELGSRQLLINGTFISGISLENYLIGHLPMMMHPDPKNVLVICFGIGTSYASTLDYPITADAVEISPNVIKGFGETAPHAKEIIANPKGKIHIEDGRSFLLLSNKKYDVITIDASPPLYSAGTVNLLTEEFLALSKARLNPGGQMMLWIPTSSATTEDFRMILATYKAVFPHVSLWGLSRGSGVLMFGSEKPIAIDISRLGQLLSNKNISRIFWPNNVDSRKKVGDILSLFIIDGEETDAFTGGAPIITDDHPYTEFPLFRRNLNSQGMKNTFLYTFRKNTTPLIKTQEGVVRHKIP